MIERGTWDIPTVGWGSALASTGIEPRQLRSAIDRGLLKFGEKQGNRLMFTDRERFGIDVAAMLTSVWVPISTACEVATAILPQVEAINDFWKRFYVAECTAGLPSDYQVDDDTFMARIKAVMRPNIEDIPALTLLVKQDGGAADLSFITNRAQWIGPEPSLSLAIDYPAVSIGVSMIEAMKRHVLRIFDKANPTADDAIQPQPEGSASV